MHLVGRGDAEAGVLAQHPGVLAVGADLEVDGAVRSAVLDRVAGQVVDDLAELVGVGGHQHRLVGHGEAHLHPTLLGLHRHQVEALLGELAQVHRQAHGLALVLDLGVVEEVLHQAVEPLGVARDRLDRADAGVEVLQQLDVADDRGQRRLQLVGDGRDQLALVAVELLELAHQVTLAVVEPGVEDHPAERAADLHHRFLLLRGPGAHRWSRGPAARSRAAPGPPPPGRTSGCRRLPGPAHGPARAARRSGPGRARRRRRG